MKRLFVSFCAIFSLILLAACGDGTPVIYSIDGNKVTTASFETAYDTALDTLSRTQNVEKKTLIKYLTEREEQVPQVFLPIRQEFKKKKFFENYRQMLVIKAAADKSGFSKRKDIKEILKFQEMQLISNMYIAEQVESRIKITETELEDACTELRKKYKQAEALTLEQCYETVRGPLKGRKSQEILPEVMDRIKESVTIKNNEKFDDEKYKNQDFEFPGVKKEEAPAATPAATPTPEPTK